MYIYACMNTLISNSVKVVLYLDTNIVDIYYVHSLCNMFIKNETMSKFGLGATRS